MQLHKIFLLITSFLFITVGLLFMPIEDNTYTICRSYAYAEGNFDDIQVTISYENSGLLSGSTKKTKSLVSLSDENISIFNDPLVNDAAWVMTIYCIVDGISEKTNHTLNSGSEITLRVYSNGTNLTIARDMIVEISYEEYISNGGMLLPGFCIVFGAGILIIVSISLFNGFRDYIH